MTLPKDRDPREWPVIMQVVIGSQAHGLATEESDTDVRQVFVIPSERLLTPVLNKPKDAWSDKEKSLDMTDRAGWEVGKLVSMVLHGHPNSVEVLFAPNWGDFVHGTVYTKNFYSERIRELKNCVPAGPFARGAIGYGQNCIKKLIDGDRRKKWASTYLRALYASEQYLITGAMPVHMSEFNDATETYIRMAREEKLSVGEVLDIGDATERRIKRVVEEGSVLPALPDLKKAHRIVKEIRHDFQAWS